LYGRGDYVLVRLLVLPSSELGSNQTTPLCSRRGSYLYQIIGDPKFLDRVEQIAFNALPGTLTGGRPFPVLLHDYY
jgi:hypothetical protein